MVAMRSVWGVVFVGWVSLSSVVVAADGGGDPALAKAQIQETSQKVIALFKDPDLIKPENRDALVDRLRAVLDERFDWPTIGRWVLATNRSLFNDAQTDEFAKLFADFAVLFYLTQVKQNVTGSDASLVDQVRIEYRDGKRRDDGSLSLEVLFTSPKGSQVLTTYTLVYGQDPAAWRVRNFSVEGVSIVRNWRTELAPIKSREKIMDLLKGKVAELRAALAAPAAKE
jgi:phospholipid transport system substrate-binding protein